MVEVVISGNKCFGVKQVYNVRTGRDDLDVHDIDSDQNGWIALCEAMKDSSIQKLGFADIGMGPVGMKTLAKTIPTIPGLIEVVLSDNPSLVEADLDLLKQAASCVTIIV